jgi:NADPH:quinone reductase-like Zn-dependent oxidoreductase
VRAALVSQIGNDPVLGEHPDPQPSPGKALIEVTAAPLNPVDLSIADGRFYAGSPSVPYVPGNEGFGRVIESQGLSKEAKVWFQTPAGLAGDGALAERVLVDENNLVEAPHAIEDSLAACFGIAGVTAWLALDWRGGLQAGQTVLVLGASGAVGCTAVQAARLLGAGRVVAAARDEQALAQASDLGADATVKLGSGSPAEVAAQLSRAAEGEIDLVIDPLWGQPVAAASLAASPRARIVSLGQSAGREATFASDAVRGKMLDICGLSMPQAPRSEVASAYRKLLDHASRGEIKLEYETYPLEQVAKAWQRQASFPHRKLVVVP